MLSVLMAVHKGDQADWLTESLASIQRQTRLADQVVIVFDGPVTGEVSAAINYHRTTLPLKIVEIDKNIGLGAALRAGLEHCEHEYVARMDADDICVPTRFEIQLSFLERHPEVGVLGSWIGEFDGRYPEKIYAIRRVPESHDAILKLARLRNPFNHMTVVFRKRLVEQVGGYRSVRGLEDYDLWVRVLRSGARVRNLPEPLVWARAGADLLERRGGMAYLSREYLLLFEFYKSGFIGLSDLLIGLSARTLIRLAPRKLRELSYRGIRLYGSYK